MSKRVSVSVGICAINEEKNIANVLTSILSQKGTYWELREIFVYNDGSTDNTIEQVTSLNNPKIHVLQSPTQKGKANGINRIISQSKGDMIVLFDADITLKNDAVIEHLMRPLIATDNVMVVGGNSRPFAPKTFFEKAVYSTFQVFKESRNTLKGGHNIYGCTGSCLAMRSTFAKTLHLPKVVADDSYIYLFCIQQGYAFRHVNDAVVYYKLPQNLKDYLRQVFRSDPIAATMNLEKYFANLAAREHHRPFIFYVIAIGKAFLKNPFGVLFISFINAACRPLFPFISKRYKLDWHIVTSTK